MPRDVYGASIRTKLTSWPCIPDLSERLLLLDLALLASRMNSWLFLRWQCSWRSPSPVMAFTGRVRGTLTWCQFSSCPLYDISILQLQLLNNWMEWLTFVTLVLPALSTSLSALRRLLPPLGRSSPYGNSSMLPLGSPRLR